MVPPVLIAFVNQSTLLHDSDAALIAEIVGKQGLIDLGPLHGIAPRTMFVPKGASPPLGSSPCYFKDTLEIEGALGYHDVDSTGVPFIVVACESLAQGGSAFEGPDAISVTASHEYLEVVGDPSANLWADGPDGVHDYAYELADATEGDAYAIEGVSVSNFLLPAFFNPHSSVGTRLDFMGVVKQPFETRPRGYQIIRTEPGTITNTFGDGEIAMAKPGLYLHFGDDFPESKKMAKIEKARRRRGRR